MDCVFEQVLHGIENDTPASMAAFLAGGIDVSTTQVRALCRMFGTHSDCDGNEGGSFAIVDNPGTWFSYGTHPESGPGTTGYFAQLGSAQDAFAEALDLPPLDSIFLPPHPGDAAADGVNKIPECLQSVPASIWSSDPKERCCGVSCLRNLARAHLNLVLKTLEETLAASLIRPAADGGARGAQPRTRTINGHREVAKGSGDIILAHRSTIAHYRYETEVALARRLLQHLPLCVKAVSVVLRRSNTYHSTKNRHTPHGLCPLDVIKDRVRGDNFIAARVGLPSFVEMTTAECCKQGPMHASEKCPQNAARKCSRATSQLSPLEVQGISTSRIFCLTGRATCQIQSPSCVRPQPGLFSASQGGACTVC